MDAIIKKYGFKEGLVTKAGKIIEWPYDEPKPSQAELDLLIKEFDLDTKYKELRARAYPAIEEQLDKIFHEGFDAWKLEIQAIKDKYPKPE